MTIHSSAGTKLLGCCFPSESKTLVAFDQHAIRRFRECLRDTVQQQRRGARTWHMESPAQLCLEPAQSPGLAASHSRTGPQQCPSRTPIAQPAAPSPSHHRVYLQPSNHQRQMKTTTVGDPATQPGDHYRRCLPTVQPNKEKSSEYPSWLPM